MYSQMARQNSTQRKRHTSTVERTSLLLLYICQTTQGLHIRHTKQSTVLITNTIPEDWLH